eukprot:g183.t1
MKELEDNMQFFRSLPVYAISLYLASTVSSTLCTIIGALTKDSRSGNFVSVLVLLFFLMFSGALINNQTVKDGSILFSWIRYISPYGFVLESLLIAQMQGQCFYFNPKVELSDTAALVCAEVSGETWLLQLGCTPAGEAYASNSSTASSTILNEMNMTPEQIRDRTRKIAEENEKFNDLLSACEEKLGLDIDNGGNSGKKKKQVKKKQSASAEDENFQSPRDIMRIKYGETNVNDMSTNEVYAAMRKRSPGPYIIQPVESNANHEIRAEFAALPRPSIPVIRYSDTLDWRESEANRKRGVGDSVKEGEEGVFQPNKKSVPQPTSSNLYNDGMFLDERYEPAHVQPRREAKVDQAFAISTSDSNDVNNVNKYSSSKYNVYGDDLVHGEGPSSMNDVHYRPPPPPPQEQSIPILPPSPFVKRQEWVNTRISSENEWEHRRLASLSTMHAAHVGSLNYLQDYHRQVVQEACNVDYILEEAKDMLYQAKSMAKRCIALKQDQPHEITKKLWDMLRNKYHPNDVGIKLFNTTKQKEDEKLLKEEVNSMKAQLSHCLGLLDMYKEQRDMLATDNKKLRDELTRVYVEQEELNIKLTHASEATKGYDRPKRVPPRPISESKSPRRRRSSSGSSSLNGSVARRRRSSSGSSSLLNGSVVEDQIYSNYSHSTNKSPGRRLSNGRRPSFR